MAGSVGLSSTQERDLADYISRRDGTHPKGLKLTPKMEEAMNDLLFKRDNPELPQGAKSYCKQWLKEALYGRREEIRSKYIDKGNECEEDGFTLMAVQLKLGMVFKNIEHFEDEHIIGTPDLIKMGVVYDNKCSWSLSTFPMFESAIPDPDYFYQLQGYMALTGLRSAVLAYTLVDAPEWMVEKETQYSDDPFTTINNMVFTESGLIKYGLPLDKYTSIPDHARIKTFNVYRDDLIIEQIRERVMMCRDYIETLLAGWEVAA